MMFLAAAAAGCN